MALNTEGSTFVGVVVQNGVCGGEKDPLGLQRVKVLCPALHHPQQNKDDAPWSYVNMDNHGISRNSILRQGQFVNIKFEPGSKSSGNPGMIVSAYNGVQTPNDRPPEGYQNENPTQGGNGQDFAKTGWLKAARESRPTQESAGAQTKQKKGTNSGDSGIAPVTSEVTYRQAPSYEELAGLPLDLAAKLFIRTSKGINSIYSASAWSGLLWDTGDGKTGNPNPDPNNEQPRLTADLGSGIKDPVLKKGFENLVKLFPGYEADSRTVHFSNDANKVSGEWKSKARSELASAQNMVELMDKITKIMSQAFFEETTKSKEKQHQVETPFGNLQMKVKGNGEVEFPNIKEIAEKKGKFIKELMNKVPSASSTKSGGSVQKDKPFQDTDGTVQAIGLSSENGMFRGGLLAGDLFMRLPKDKAKQIKRSIKSFAEGDSKALIFAFARFAANEGNYKTDSAGASISTGSTDMGTVAPAWEQGGGTISI